MRLFGPRFFVEQTKGSSNNLRASRPRRAVNESSCGRLGCQSLCIVQSGRQLRRVAFWRGVAGCPRGWETKTVSETYSFMRNNVRVEGLSSDENCKVQLFNRLFLFSGA